MASCWCGRGSNVSRRERLICMALSPIAAPGKTTSQLIGDSEIADTPMRLVGITWLASISSALEDQRSVVEMIRRLLKCSTPSSVSNVRPEASKKESRFDLLILVDGK